MGVSRKSLNLLQCPGGGSTDEDKVIALRAMARTAQAAAPGCYSTYTDGNQTEPRETQVVAMVDKPVGEIEAQHTRGSEALLECATLQTLA